MDTKTLTHCDAGPPSFTAQVMAKKLRVTPNEWATTADIDGDLAIYDAKNRMLIGVGATVIQTVNIVDRHNADIFIWRDRALKAEETAGRLIKESIEEKFKKSQKKRLRS